MSLIFALVMIQTAGAVPQRPILTATQVAATSPAMLADTLLPASHPPILRVQVLPERGDPATRPLDAVLLYARPAPGPRGFCRSDVFRVTFAPFEYATDARSGGRRYRARGTTRTGVFRLSEGGDCLTDTRGYFPIAGAEATGLAAVRALAATRRAAATGAPLPAITCADPTRGGACREGARTVVAALRTDAIGSVRVGACATTCPVEILVGTAGARPAYWTITLTLRGTIATRIAMAYTLSPGG